MKQLISLINGTKNLIEENYTAFKAGCLITVVPNSVFLGKLLTGTLHFVVAFITHALGVVILTALSGITNALVMRWFKRHEKTKNDTTQNPPDVDMD